MKDSRYFMFVFTLINCAAAGVVVFNLSNASAQAAVQSATETIRTQRIELIDKAGQVRGQFFVEENGEVVFRMRDESGQIRVKLGASGRGAGLVLMDDRTEPAVQMRAGISALSNQRDTNVTLRDGPASRTLTPKK